MKYSILTAVAASSLFFTSCGGDKNDTGVNKEKLTPTEAVENWKKDVTDGRVLSLWDSLPSDYQGDLTKLVQTFGEKVDKELYNEAMSTAGAASSLLKNKRDIILEIIKENAPKEKLAEVKDLDKSYDAIVGIFDTITNSGAKDVDGLKEIDLAKLLGELQVHTKELAELAAAAGGEDYQKFVGATVASVSESGDDAVVKVTADGKEEEIKLTRKGERWLPAEMVQEWPKMMEEANKGLNQVGSLGEKEKYQAMMGLMMVKTAIQNLEKSNTKEEMMEKVGGMMKMFGGM